MAKVATPQSFVVVSLVVSAWELSDCTLGYVPFRSGCPFSASWWQRLASAGSVARMRLLLAFSAACNVLQLFSGPVEGSRSVESAYDSNKNVFSPQGRLVQLDYVEVCAGPVHSCTWPRKAVGRGAGKHAGMRYHFMPDAQRRQARFTQSRDGIPGGAAPLFEILRRSWSPTCSSSCLCARRLNDRQFPVR